MGENHQSRKYNKQNMSQANAAARKRRAGGSSMPGAPEPMVQQQQPAAGLTLPQVIALVDKRLVNLETFMKETKASVPKTSVPVPSVQPSVEMDDALVEEINTKFELLATEVAERVIEGSAPTRIEMCCDLVQQHDQLPSKLMASR
jgi:hypothetical protein